jgi:hypothetical protein
MARPLSLARFRPRLHDVWVTCGRPARWPEAEARTAWRKHYPGLAWPRMDPRTWQRRMHELLHDPEPPEVEPERLAAKLAAARFHLKGLRKSPIFSKSDLTGEESAIAQMEAQLAAMRHAGPKRHKRRQRRSKVAQP